MHVSSSVLSSCGMINGNIKQLPLKQQGLMYWMIFFFVVCMYFLGFVCPSFDCGFD
jgi:hypothetical protein